MKNLKCIKERKGIFISYKILNGNNQLAFAVSNINYSEKMAIEMFLNKGFLFQI